MNFTYHENQILLYDKLGTIIAEVTFPDIDATTVDINHTFVDDSLRGQGVAGKLMEEVANQLRLKGKKAILTCSFAIHWFSKHQEEYQDILKETI